MKLNWLFENFPFISSENLTLSMIQSTETANILDLFRSDDSFMPSMGIDSPQAAMAFLKSVEASFRGGKSLFLGIYMNSNPNELTGSIQIRSIDLKTESCEIGYNLRPKFRHKGIITEAVSAAVKYLFEMVEVKRIYARCLAGHENSEKVLLRCGFEKEGTCRNGAYWEGIGIVSISTYAILAEDYDEIKGGTLLCRDSGYSIVRMNGSDYEDMAGWLSDKEVTKHMTGNISEGSWDLERVASEFGPHVNGETNVIPCIIRENGKKIGYIQFAPWDIEIPKTNGCFTPYSIDMFIGDTSCTDRGAGSKAIRMMCKYLFAVKKADLISAEPKSKNTKYVRTLEKSGFIKDHEISDRSGDRIVMYRR